MALRNCAGLGGLKQRERCSGPRVLQAPRSLCGLRVLVGRGRRERKRERKRNRWSFTPGQALREQGLEFRAVCGPGALSSRELPDPGRWVRVRPGVSPPWVLGEGIKVVNHRDGMDAGCGG